MWIAGRVGVARGQISDVLGELIEVGLVRLQLMERTAATLAPTGRVVAFSNSVVLPCVIRWISGDACDREAVARYRHATASVGLGP
jgi:hypothetical protein